MQQTGEYEIELSGELAVRGSHASCGQDVWQLRGGHTLQQLLIITWWAKGIGKRSRAHFQIDIVAACMSK